jgi:hypothetical protein
MKRIIPEHFKGVGRVNLCLLIFCPVTPGSAPCGGLCGCGEPQPVMEKIIPGVRKGEGHPHGCGFCGIRTNWQSR